MSVQVTVIGSEPAWPSAARACSGYLVRSGDTTLLVDCGTGVFAQLRTIFRPEELTGIIISHLHFDHWADLVPFRYYLRYEARSSAPPRLYLPPDGAAKLQGITEAFDRDDDFLAGTFDTSEYDPEQELQIGQIRIAFRRTLHPIETYAMKLASQDRVIVYSADTGWDESLAQFVSGAHLFLCETAWGAGESGGPMHLTATEAARLATLGQASQLALIHLAEHQAVEAVQAAQSQYSGAVSYAAAGKTFDV